MVIEPLTKLTVRLRDGQRIKLEPGRPVSLDEETGRRLLERAPNKVRLVPSAARPPVPPGPGPCPGCGGPLAPFAEYDTATATYKRGYQCAACGHETERPPETAEAIQFEPAPHPSPTVFWESGGRILGPARVVAFAKAGEEFWLLIEYGRESRWIRDELLRSRRAYETQRPLRPIEPIREL